MRVIAWNVNSIRIRLPNLQTLVAQRRPDILLLQEIKATEETFPYDFIQSLNLHAIIVGQKSYNGVAVLSKKPVTLIQNTILAEDEQARYLEVMQDGVHYISVYVPNGNPVETKLSYKLSFLNSVFQRLTTLVAQKIPFVLGGDFNLIPTDVDCYDPAVFIGDALAQQDVVDYYQKFLDLGLVDTFTRDAQGDAKNPYTWWDYRNGGFENNYGARIDFLFLCPIMATAPYSFSIDSEQRALERPSDHAPVLVNSMRDLLGDS